MKIILWGSLFIVVYIFLIHRAYKTGMSKAVRRLYEEQDSKGSICEHVVQISEEGIFEKTDVNERKDKWFGVQRIAVENDYAFIYVGANQAHIIPRKRIIEGNLDEFIETAKSYWQKGKSNKTAGV